MSHRSFLYFWVSASIAAVLLIGCTGSSPTIAAPGTIPQYRATATQTESSRRSTHASSGPFLYVAGLRLSMYELGSSAPLHVATMEPATVYKAALALDLHGHLCEANGEISYAQLLEYDAATLTFKRGVTGVGAFPALVADRLGYLYASTGGGAIEVYTPGCTHHVNVIRQGVDLVQPIVFDRFGNLYAGMRPHYSVSVYAPTNRPGHMEFRRQITDGIYNPIALASGPSGDLSVANSPPNGKGKGYVTVYQSGSSKPALEITSGINFPRALAVDSKDRLYVDNNPSAYGGTGGDGWISVYPPGSSRWTRKVKIADPVAIALDASDNLYVANLLKHSSVLVYSPGAKKLLQTIKAGVDQPSALLIGSP